MNYLNNGPVEDECFIPLTAKLYTKCIAFLNSHLQFDTLPPKGIYLSCTSRAHVRMAAELGDHGM